MKSINPATEELLYSFNPIDNNELLSKVKLAQNAHEQLKKSDLSYRADCLLKAAEQLRLNKDKFSTLMANEMGKPIVQGRSEIEKCAWVCEYYANEGVHFLKDEHIKTEANSSFVTYKPLGVILGIMPWNFPFWQVFRFAAPSILAGNAVLLKHSPNVFACSRIIEEIFQSIGLIENTYQNLIIDIEQVPSLIENPIVKAMTLTGSTRAGRQVAKLAGSHLKKIVLELGGSDPYVILEDADIKLAANACKVSRLVNSGQSCVAAKRIIVVETVLDSFIEEFLPIMKDQIIDSPLLETTQIGPLARNDLREHLHQQIETSISMGAECLIGGQIPARKGYFYPVTILSNVSKGMPAYDEELFGPATSIICVKNEAEAIRVANDSIYGLGAAVFTRNLEKGKHIASNEIDAGCCFVNDFVKSDPRLPFGGVKSSGFGRELSHHGIKEFVNAKTIYI